ncbi:HAMP domain-containing protein, partial [Salmonella sp. SAL04286]|uniref:HAMP domain-containing protein n=1 Tax=Salmonella sp. SAL04286 TaxID=3159864 RepID=UPI00397891BE
VLLNATSDFVNQWNGIIDLQLHDKVLIVQLFIIADIIVFVVVILSIRKSLSPLETLTKAISRIKEGVYGEKITYSAKDEIGELADTFN